MDILTQGVVTRIDIKEWKKPRTISSRSGFLWGLLSGGDKKGGSQVQFLVSKYQRSENRGDSNLVQIISFYYALCDLGKMWSILMESGLMPINIYTVKIDAEQENPFETFGLNMLQ